MRKRKGKNTQEIIEDIKKNLGIPVEVEAEKDESIKFEPKTEKGDNDIGSPVYSGFNRR